MFTKCSFLEENFSWVEFHTFYNLRCLNFFFRIQLRLIALWVEIRYAYNIFVEPLIRSFFIPEYRLWSKSQTQVKYVITSKVFSIRDKDPKPSRRTKTRQIFWAAAFSGTVWASPLAENTSSSSVMESPRLRVFSRFSNSAFVTVSNLASSIKLLRRQELFVWNNKKYQIQANVKPENITKY